MLSCLAEGIRFVAAKRMVSGARRRLQTRKTSLCLCIVICLAVSPAKAIPKNTQIKIEDRANGSHGQMRYALRKKGSNG